MYWGFFVINKFKNGYNFLKENMTTYKTGYYSYKKYVLNGVHDRKFGPNLFEYFCQFPYYTGIVFSLIYIICFVIYFLYINMYAIVEYKVSKLKEFMNVG